MSVIVDVTMVGGPYGSQYQEVQAWKVGKLITKLTVFKQENRVRGAYVWKNGEGQYDGATFGVAAGDSDTFEFQPGERITSMSLWPGRWGPNNHVRAGHIWFTTSNGRNFDAGPGKWGSETKLDVGSGYLVGVEAITGSDINKWGFVFLKPLLLLTLTDVEYPSLNEMGGVVPVTLDSLDETNDSKNSDLNWTLEGSKSETISWEFSKAEGLTATVGFQVSAGIPEIGLGETGSFQWEVSNSTTRTASHSQVTDLKWSTGGVLRPGERVTASALTQVGKLSNLFYNGTIVIKTQDSHCYSYPVSGVYSGATVTNVQVAVDVK
ncbi:hypothetical protein SELMODRAFT_417619 [Selaginella moellendorffii]|uniref:Jacalin-type lectin domain-containing protein n=2 Tax=Selaginella moellendorffii TaxID=88036 RepID=D8S316_SELML|nr:hypothetical protein SELMODRAFT_417619 [Selaginella moellendorffii]